MARKQFQIWNVAGEEYKLKLSTSGICKLEEKLKMGLMDVLETSKNMPPLSIMLTVTHAALKEQHSGIKQVDVEKMFDKYIEEGGSQLKFFTDVFMGIYQVSGFFTEDQAEMMDVKLAEAKEEME